jgi:hypothetical protein
MATKHKAAETESGLHITEGIGGTWHYHLSVAGTNATALCGKKTMLTALPLASWGMASHLPQRYCKDCEQAGLAELTAAGATISSSPLNS